MCGIAAIWGDTDESSVREMLGALAHRGPDAEGWHVTQDGNATLGNRRLAIIDLEHGDQPILEPAGASIVSNAEIYNYRELRASLPDPPLHTQSDTEVTLQIYRQFGNEAPSHLDGMYAFAVSDGEHLFAARDPLGIKPLYIGRRGDVTMLASELKALAGRVDDIREFPPGTLYHSSEGFRRFYEVPEPARDETAYLSLDDAIRETRERLEDAVRKRLVADVPVGSLLSGGVDSSAVAAIAARYVDDLHTFAVGMAGSQDLEAARLVAKHIGSTHHEYVVTPDDIRGVLPDVLYHLETYDQPSVHSSSAMYFVSKMAAEHLKVVLVGEGADELFAGYPFYTGVPEARLNDILRESVSALHNLSLQRVDRMTMAHSLEARVPFLDPELVAVAQRIRPEHKLHVGPAGVPIEKWVLRRAVEDLLPPEIAWKKKDGFDQSTRAEDFFAEEIDSWMDAREANRYRAAHPFADLRTQEEAVFHRILSDALPEPETILNMGRWSDIVKW
jgi:asparagine synthase (glutamine-hydrolysing)